jgi:hypothetical protein
LNLAAALPPELESGVAPVESQIATYLAQQGKTVERLPLRDATRLWRASVTELSESGAAPRFGAVAQRFAQSLRRTHDFDALVMPVLLLDRVPVRHRTASWDGVTRRVRVVNAPRRTAGRNDSLMADGLVDGGSLHATMPVSSLYVMVLTPAGERVFHGRGGIDFVDELDLANVAETYTFEIRRREDLFEDQAVLRESIAAAFTPYLPPVREP